MRNMRCIFWQILVLTIVSGCTATRQLTPKLSTHEDFLSQLSGTLHFTAVMEGPDGVARPGLYSINPATGVIESRILLEDVPSDLKNRSLQFSRPAWSIDGHEMVFDIQETEKGCVIVRTDSAGSEYHVISQRQKPDANSPENYRVLRYPIWSPGGKRIAFIEEAPKAMTAGLYTIGREGGDLQKVSDLIFSYQSPPAALTWSPDGKRFAIDYLKGLLTEEGKISEIITEIRFVSFEGDELPTIRGHNSAWSPDGKKLAYVADNPTMIQLLDLETWTSKLLFEIENGLKIRKLAWSPKGGHLCYLVSEEKDKTLLPKQRLEVISLGTGEYQRIPVSVERFGASELYWTSDEDMKLLITKKYKE